MPDTGAAQFIRLQSGESLPEIKLCECPHCGHRGFPPVLLGCERCGARDLHVLWTKATGRILSRALVPLPKSGSTTIASLELDAGPVIRAIVQDPVEPGDTVEGVLVPEDDEETVRFQKTS